MTEKTDVAFLESNVPALITGFVLCVMMIVRGADAGFPALVGMFFGAALAIGVFFVLARMFLRARVAANGGDTTICWNVALIAYVLLYILSWIVIGV